jgi:chaperone required for assembly of F1-ATPase
MKRFYSEVSVAAEGDDWRVLLDGRGIRTPGKRAQAVPRLELAEAMATEWAEQPEELDPKRFVLRDLADFAIDVVAPDRRATIAALLPYAETDTLCYRAEPDAPLHERQLAVWEPLLVAAERRWDIHFERVSGVIHRPQPPATLARMEAVLAAESSFRLAALRTLASLSSSLVIALAAIAPGAELDALWQASELEEEWQAELWGREAEAEARRAARFAAFKAAALFADLSVEY